MTAFEVPTHDGLTVFAERDGTGPPVLLVHGLGFTRALWRRPMDRLIAAGFSVISFDLRGFGDTFMPQERYTMSDLCNDLEAVRAAAGTDTMHVVAHSMGGMVAQQYALAHPERVTSLFLISTTAHNGRRASAFARVMALLSEKGFAESKRDPTIWQHAVDTIAEVIPYTGPAMKVLEKLTERPSPARSFAWHAIADFSVKDHVSSIACPTLVMHGDADPNIPFSAGRLLHEAIKGSIWVPLEGARHNLPIEHPDLFDDELLSFLRGIAS